MGKTCSGRGVLALLATLSTVACSTPKRCIGSDGGACAPACVPTTCVERGTRCGYLQDGCGNLLTCSDCNGGPVVVADAGPLLLRAQFVPVTPVRVADTRPGSGNLYGGQTLAPDGGLTVLFSPTYGVPKVATAAVFKLTAVTPSAPGSFAALPAGVVPLAAPLPLLTFDGGAGAMNMVQMALGGQGGITFLNQSAGTADLVVELSGFFIPTADPAAQYIPVAPVRFFDNPTSNTSLGPGQVVNILSPRPSVLPANATAVVFNLTGASASVPTFFTVYPSGAVRPQTRDLEVPVTVFASSRVTASVGADGGLLLYNNAGTVLGIADLSGYYVAGGAGFRPVTPTRLFDSRIAVGPLGSGQTVKLNVGHANAVVLNVTGINPSAGTYFVIWDSDQPKPGTSDVNFLTGTTVSNTVIVQPAADGTVSLFNNAGTISYTVDELGVY